MAEKWMSDERAKHPFPIDVADHACSMCCGPAAHKVGEEVEINFHNLTNWLCCEHFVDVMRYDCARYPYGGVV